MCALQAVKYVYISERILRNGYAPGRYADAQPIIGARYLTGLGQDPRPGKTVCLIFEGLITIAFQR